MKYLALIQARCGSSRLPNKVLRKLGNRTALEWVISRVKKSKSVDEVMVVTSIEKNNFPILKLCIENDTRVYAGSEDDVLDRYYQAARLLKPEYIIRITADCPVFDYQFLDMAIEQLQPETDYMGDLNETFPDGLDIEIIKYSALKESWEKATMLLEREHVTLYIKRNRDKFQIQNLVCPISGISDKRWTLDEEKDYLLLNEIYSFFLKQSNEDFVTEEILSFLNANPELNCINDGIARNEGFYKKIDNDIQVVLE